MVPVVRSSGTTVSEQYLAQLAERSFLNLWSYPNLFIDKQPNGKGDGKELCDLLVVCGDHVLVFNDKTIAWPDVDNIELAWQRWFKRAVEKSAKQVLGAIRWIDQFPERIFLDAQCTTRLPLEFPPANRRKIHGIVVALGAGDACEKYFAGDSGSLLIFPGGEGSQNPSSPFPPFTIGDLNPNGPFIHVLDDISLDIVMRELDTVVDFTSYLSKKEAFIRLGCLLGAHGEEELLAYYLTHMNTEDEHDFTHPDGSSLGENETIMLGDGFYGDLITNPQYIKKKKADEISYVWDRLITQFTDHLLAGTSITPEGTEFVLANYEEAIRFMALELRFARRHFGEGIIDALEKGQIHNRFTRGLIPPDDGSGLQTGYFFLTLSVPTTPIKGGYEQYRQTRKNMLEAYAFTFLQKYPYLYRIIGIGTEPPPKEGEKSGSSEDLVFVENPDWTESFVEELEERKTLYSIDQPGNTVEYAVHGDEYPQIENDTERKHHPKLNRQQRRANKARSTRRK